MNSKALAALPARSGWMLFACGLPGVLAISVQVIPLMFRGRALPVPLWLMELAVATQSSLMLALAVVIGCWAAPRVGLGVPLLSALLERREWRSIARRQGGAGMVGGALGAGLLLVLPALAPAGLRAHAAAPELPGLARLLYGGMTEELLMRWGAMSLIAWLSWRLLQYAGRSSRPPPIRFAILSSALLFGLGHLPAAQRLLGPLTPEAIAYLLLGNGAFGLVAGWLFWRRGLEAAMLAHVLAHGLVMLTTMLN